jgi:hypothetical protein
MSKAEQTGTREQFRPHGAEAFGAPNGPEAAAARSLAEAAEAGDAARVASLLASGAFADARLRGGETPLMRASARGYADVARTLLDAGADAAARRTDGFTPLILAAFFGHEEVVRLLLERGADTSARTDLGTTAEKWAESRGFAGVTSLLRVAALKASRSNSDATHVHARTLPDATRAGSSSDPLADVGIFSRKGGTEKGEVPRASVASRPKGVEGAAVEADEVSTASASSSSADAPVREGKRTKNRVVISIRDDGPEPAHPSESPFKLGRFMRSWQASIGTALLLVAFFVGAYALWRRGGASEALRPAPATQQPVAQQPAPAQVLPAQQPQATPLAPEAQVSPTPDLNAYPMAGNASQPYYDPPVTNNIPPSGNIPRELTVVSESGAPTPDDTARAKRKPDAAGDSAAAPQPTRSADGSKADDSARGDADRTARSPDAETRPTPRPTPPTPAPSSNPERGKVIQWPPQ